MNKIYQVNYYPAPFNTLYIFRPNSDKPKMYRNPRLSLVKKLLAQCVIGRGDGLYIPAWKRSADVYRMA